MDKREHAQTKHIKLDEAEVVDIIFVPLGHNAAGHGGPFQGKNIGERCGGYDHAADMDAEMPRETGDAVHHIEKLRPRLCRHMSLEFVQAGKVLGDAMRGVVLHGTRHTLNEVDRQAHCLGHIPHGIAGLIGDNVADHAGTSPVIFLVDILDELLTVAVAVRGDTPLARRLG